MTVLDYDRLPYTVSTIEWDGTEAVLAEIIELVGLTNVEVRQSESPGRKRLYVYGEVIDVGDLVSQNVVTKQPERKITRRAAGTPSTRHRSSDMSDPFTDYLRTQVIRLRDRMKGHVVFGQRINSPDMELVAAYWIGHFDGKQEAAGGDAKLFSGNPPISIDRKTETA